MNGVIDISHLGGVSDSGLLLTQDDNNHFFRLNKGQVQRLFHLFFVENARRGYPAHKQDRDRVLDSASRLYDAYSAIPAGSFYAAMSDPFREDVTYAEVQQDGSPSEWISQKRFDGFVVEKLVFGKMRKDSLKFLPDREVFVPWNLDSAGLLSIGPFSMFFEDSYLIGGEKEFRDHIKFNHDLRQRLARKIAPEGTKMRVEDLKAPRWNFSLRELSEARGETFNTWEDVYRHELKQSEVSMDYVVHRSRAVCEDVGFMPETGRVSSPIGLSDFLVRFLGFKEPGREFSDAAYDSWQVA